MKNDKLNKELAKRLRTTKADVYKLVDNYEKEIKKSYARALREIKAELDVLFVKAGENPTPAILLKQARLNDLYKKISDRLGKTTKEVNKSLYEAIKGQLEENYLATVYGVEQTIKQQINFSMLNDKTIRTSVLNSNDKIKWTNSLKKNQAKLNAQIRKEVTNGLIQGKSYQQVSKILTDRLNIGTFKSIRIIRTEAHRVQNLANVLAFEEIENSASDVGLQTGRVWIATLDNKTRDTHQELDGQEADENGMFDLNGLKVEAPGLTGIAEEDINCRCTAEVFIKGFEPKQRKDNETKEIIKFQTYKEWKKVRT